MQYRDRIVLAVLPLIYHFDQDSARKGHRVIAATDDELATWAYRLADAVERERVTRGWWSWLRRRVARRSRQGV